MSVFDRDFEALDYGKQQKAKLTSKQYLVYSYLMYMSKWDAKSKEDHYFTYKNSFKIKDACETIGISQPTWRTAIEKLTKEDYIKDEGYAYLIYIPNSYVPLHIDLIKYLTEFGSCVDNGGSIVSVYSVICKYWESTKNSSNGCEVTINQLYKIFISRGHKNSRRPFEIMMGIFQTTGLMSITEIPDVYRGEDYIRYKINYVCRELPNGLKTRGYGPDDITSIVEALNSSIP